MSNIYKQGRYGSNTGRCIAAAMGACCVSCVGAQNVCCLAYKSHKRILFKTPA